METTNPTPVHGSTLTPLPLTQTSPSAEGIQSSSSSISMQPITNQRSAVSSPQDVPRRSSSPGSMQHGQVRRRQAGHQEHEIERASGEGRTGGSSASDHVVVLYETEMSPAQANAAQALSEVLGMTDVEQLMMLPRDVVERIALNAAVFAKHGVTTAEGVREHLDKALVHDTVMTILKNFIGNLGYTFGLPAYALKVAPMLSDVVSQRSAITGGFTVTTNVATNIVAAEMLDHSFAIGPESELPPSISGRANAMERALRTAFYVGVHDAVRQWVPVGLAMNDWREGAPVDMAVVNQQAVQADAWSRNIASQMTGLRTMNALPTMRGVGAKEPTFAERFLLRSPAPLDNWMTQTANSSIFGSFKPTMAGTAKTLLHVPIGMLRAVANLPTNASLSLMGAWMISTGLLSAGARSAEYGSNHSLPTGFEDPHATVDRRAIFGWNCETTLEFGLMLVGPLVDQMVTQGQMSALSRHTNNWVDGVRDATDKLVDRMFAPKEATQPATGGSDTGGTAPAGGEGTRGQAA